MLEFYRPIPANPYYLISNLGNVRSIPRRIRTKRGHARQIPGGKLSPGRTGDGYLTVNLCRGGKRRSHYVHALVARAFVGPPPGPVGCRRGEYQVHHINGKREDNRATNLQWLLVQVHQRIPKKRRKTRKVSPSNGQAPNRPPLHGQKRGTRSPRRRRP